MNTIPTSFPLSSLTTCSADIVIVLAMAWANNWKKHYPFGHTFSSIFMRNQMLVASISLKNTLCGCMFHTVQAPINLLTRPVISNYLFTAFLIESLNCLFVYFTQCKMSFEGQFALICLTFNYWLFQFPTLISFWLFMSQTSDTGLTKYLCHDENRLSVGFTVPLVWDLVWCVDKLACSWSQR